jgi:hypothetical protein
MKPFRPLLFVLAAAACERGKAPARADSSASNPVVAADSAASAPRTTWDASAGPVLLVAADSSDAAYLMWPDSAAAETTTASLPSPTTVILFGRNGSVQSARLPSLNGADACEPASITAAPPPRPWNVGFIGGVVSPLALDSAASLTPSDSAYLVVWMNRLASAVPSDSTGAFSGLPFVVRALWRFTLPDGSTTVAAELERQVNQEARPLQERTFLIAGHPAGDSTFVTAYVERSSGAELTVEDVDVLAAVTIGASHTPALVISRDFGDGVAYALLERGADRWQVRWSSPRITC